MPEDRLGTGLAPSLSVTSNVVIKTYRRRPLSHGPLLRLRRMRDAALGIIRRYDVQTPGPETPVRNLSGGNLQKLVLGREFSDEPLVLVVAQPTRGLDVGAIETVHAYLRDAAAKGVAILLMSEDLDEIRALADRILVVYEGAVVGELDAGEASIEEIGYLMAGGSAARDPPRAQAGAAVVASVAVPVGSLLVAFGIMGIVLAATGHDPGATYRRIVEAGFTGNGALSATLISATPILFTGLAAAAAFRMQLFNIGAEGQLYLGAIGASWIALQLGDHGATSTPLFVVAMCVAGGKLRRALGADPRGAAGVREYERDHHVADAQLRRRATCSRTSSSTARPTGAILDACRRAPSRRGNRCRRRPSGRRSGLASSSRSASSSASLAAAALWVLYSRTRFGFEVQRHRRLAARRALRGDAHAPEDPRGDGRLGGGRRARRREPGRRLHAHARREPERPAGGRLRLHGDRRRGARPVQPARGLPRRGAASAGCRTPASRSRAPTSRPASWA